MSREYLRAVATDITDEITGEAATVRSMAVLVTGGRPVGLAEENFIREFVEALP
jgi:protein subunit release factor B